MLLRFMLFCAALFAITAPAIAADGDAVLGEKVFKKCMSCHRPPDAKSAIGPTLHGIVGRTAGTHAGYTYSPLNLHAGENGLIWTPENIIAYLPDPNAFLRTYLTDKGKPELAVGNTKMSYKLASESERADVVAYLKTLAKP